MAKLGIVVPLAAARAEMIVTEPAPKMPLGGVDGNGLYGRQTLRGNLAYGGGPHEWIEIGETGPSRARPRPDAQSCASRGGAAAKAAHLNVIRSWAGVIENTPDGRPIIDRMRDPENIVVATMSSVGFGLSPASGMRFAISWRRAIAPSPHQQASAVPLRWTRHRLGGAGRLAHAGMNRYSALGSCEARSTGRSTGSPPGAT